MTTNPTAQTGALSGLRVIDVSEGVAGPFAARLLGDLGADVVKVEPANGDRARRLYPVEDAAEAGSLFAYLELEQAWAGNRSVDGAGAGAARGAVGRRGRAHRERAAGERRAARDRSRRGATSEAGARLGDSVRSGRSARRLAHRADRRLGGERLHVLRGRSGAAAIDAAGLPGGVSHRAGGRDRCARGAA